MRKLFILMFYVVGMAANAADTAPDFRTALEKHLNAVQNRDLDTLVDTLTTSDDLQVIFPDGSRTIGTQAVIDFHLEWFKDKNWIWTPTIDRIVEGGEQSTALVKYTYQSNSADSKRTYWLVLVFQLENGSWRLIHDQNTNILN